MIYLDNSATTQPDPLVLKSYQDAAATFFANPSSIHQLGGRVEKLLMEARQQVAEQLGVKSSEITFTSGGTEANNMAIKGIALKHQHRGRHIITSAIEHPSVLEACQSLEVLGFEVTYLPVNQTGIVSVEDVKQAIRQDTILISIMHVNSEIGSIQPIADIAAIARNHPKLFFHVDHVQGFGKVDLDISDAGIDLLTISGHKIHGLKGTGMLYVKEGTAMFPLLHGGGQEHALRAGTENLPGIVAFSKAVRLIKEKQANKADHLQDLHQYLHEQLNSLPGIQFNTPEQSAPHIMNVSTSWTKAEVLIHMLGEADIYVSTKSACSSRQTDASRVLLACGHSETRARSAIRISLSYETTEEDIRTFIDVLDQSVQQLREVMR